MLLEWVHEWGGEGMCGFRQGGVRTAGRHETMYGEGWGMCGFRQTRSDRKPQWDQGWGGVGDVRISPEALGPQAAVESWGCVVSNSLTILNQLSCMFLK